MARGRSRQRKTGKLQSQGKSPGSTQKSKKKKQKVYQAPTNKTGKNKGVK